MFNKELFLTEIAKLNDFETMKYIVQNYFTISILIIFFVPLVVEIVLYESVTNKNFWQSVIIGAGRGRRDIKITPVKAMAFCKVFC